MHCVSASRLGEKPERGEMAEVGADVEADARVVVTV